MKLDKIRFAKLIAHIQYWIDKGNLLSPADIDDIDFMINIDVLAPPSQRVSCEAVDELLRHFNSPNGFIDAIKAYRALTGAGLKESKEAIERYRNIASFPPLPESTTF